jgi:hypothetical protein
VPDDRGLPVPHTYKRYDLEMWGPLAVKRSKILTQRTVEPAASEAFRVTHTPAEKKMPRPIESRSSHSSSFLESFWLWCVAVPLIIVFIFLILTSK